jgi:hypothetical protein
MINMDYSTFKYSKGPPKKNKRAKNNPKPTDQDLCRECSKPYAHTHEAFFGRGQRQLSIKYGMQVKLCYYHHNDPSSKEAVHNNPAFDLSLKQEYQQKFEQIYGYDEFMRIFRKNYIGITVEEYTKQFKGVA